MPDSGTVFRIALITCASSTASNSLATSTDDFPDNRRRVSSPLGVCGTKTDAADIGSLMPVFLSAACASHYFQIRVERARALDGLQHRDQILRGNAEGVQPTNQLSQADAALE